MNTIVPNEKAQQGFGHIEILLIILVIGLIGVVGWLVLERQTDSHKSAAQNTNSTSATSEAHEKNVANSFSLPSGWKWYENTEHSIKVAYPKSWETSLGFTDNLEVITDADAKLHQGCGDPACEVTYSRDVQKWSGTNVTEPIVPVKSNSKSEAYLIPIKGDMYCGSYGLYIHFNDEFVHSILSLCEKNDDPDFQPKAGVLAYESVDQDLDRVIESLTKIK